ncbi:hypothetical protein ERJ75_001294500 [Trypanosoma vivax]|nr:hypothetical protein ERJ75_001294500 [Trypanosoma vivax]
MQWPLVHIKSLQGAGGALVAESGCLKIVQVHAVAAIRRANTQTSGHPAQHSQQRAVAVPPTGDRSEQQHQENNTALATSSVCPRAMQAVRNGCAKKPLKPEKEICACGDVLGFFMVTSSGHFLAACRDMLPLPLKPGFVLRDDWGEMVVGRIRLPRGRHGSTRQVRSQSTACPANGQGRAGCAGCVARVAAETPSRRGGLVLPGASKCAEGTGACAE